MTLNLLSWPPLLIAAKLMLAIICGSAISVEREINRKPAGLRTNVLICFGAALPSCFAAHRRRTLYGSSATCAQVVWNRFPWRWRDSSGAGLGDRTHNRGSNLRRGCSWHCDRRRTVSAHDFQQSHHSGVGGFAKSKTAVIKRASVSLPPEDIRPGRVS